MVRVKTAAMSGFSGNMFVILLLNFLLNLNQTWSLDSATVMDIRSQIRDMIDSDAAEAGNANSLRMLGGLVRLSFHDCVGDSCDGCINNHNPENAGLDIYINRTEELYTALEVNGEPVTMSRADFWALAGIEAVYYSNELATSCRDCLQHPPDITFQTGRVDCPTSPWTDEMWVLPSALGDNEHVLEFFSDQFGFDEKESTAILGAHTLGRAHREASGFTSPWVQRQDRLDNAFYIDLNNQSMNWVQRQTGRPEENLWSWKSQNADGSFSRLMLNSDMALIKNISDMEGGEVSCTYTSCPDVNTLTGDWVQDFASDNSLWIDEFSKAFEKMVESGWTGQLDDVEETITTARPLNTNPTQTPSDLSNEAIADIRSQIRDMIDSDAIESRDRSSLRMLGGLVRLSFHDCVGDKCDGCINNQNPENAGLDIYINRTEELYTTLEYNGEPVIMSRADFWALAGIEAVYYSNELATSCRDCLQHPPDITFRTGRTDCPTSPWTNDNWELPSALGDNEHVVEFFREQFGFDEKETAAILGAHTLGRAHREASGFTGPWVQRKDRLDNAFYIDLNNRSMNWVQGLTGRPEENLWSWKSQNADGSLSRLMLNSDMALIKNISDMEDGEVSCTYTSCPDVNTLTGDWVHDFASDNSLWIDEFSKAFEKMVESGWTGQLDEIEDTITTTRPLNTNPTQAPSDLSEEAVADIRSQIRDMIDSDAAEAGNRDSLRMLGGLVRLSFHDCVGDKCDGCINNQNPENAGLDIYINRTEELYTSLEVNGEPVTMSRADFWALAGSEAVYYSNELATSCRDCLQHPPTITFREGRTDCPTSPWTNDNWELPSALGDNEHVVEFFREQFGFDEKETTAILGAHTLGRAHREASGFTSPWVQRQDRLDNAFYIDLNNNSMNWVQSLTGRPEENLWSWKSRSPDGSLKRLMLNSDMALIRNISEMENGEVACTYSSCPVVTSQTNNWVEEFAVDNSLWIDEFSKAFEKMIESGWAGLLRDIGAGGGNGNTDATATTPDSSPSQATVTESSASDTTATSVTASDIIANIRSQIRDMIDSDAVDSGNMNSLRMLGGLVRLSFHDCVGDKCDGCINNGNPENAGLDIYINRTEQLYTTLEYNGEPVPISRADFWALAGIEAVYYSHELATCRRCVPHLPNITFHGGRTDCPTSPWTDEIWEFPNARGDNEHTVQFFRNQFDFDEKETAAILGAHTLGQAHREASGFTGPWVKGKDKLDNAFYVDINNGSMSWIQRRNGRAEENLWSWKTPNADGSFSRLMLNSDMALIKNISNMENGEVECTYATCPTVNSQTVDWVEAFAGDNNLWIDEFSKAFQKMIESGYSDTELLDIDEMALEYQTMWGPDNSTAVALTPALSAVPIMTAFSIASLYN